MGQSPCVDPSHGVPLRAVVAVGEPAHQTLLVLLLLFLTPSSLHAQPQDIRASAKADSDRTTMSGFVRVTLTIEGPAPLRVELPKQLLTDDANLAWRIRVEEAKPTITPTAKGREEWKQVYRVDAWPLLPTAGRPTTIVIG